REAARGQGADPGLSLAREQLRRAPRADRGSDRDVRRPGGPRERPGGRRLRLLVPGHLRARGPSDRRLGQVRGALRRRQARDPAPLARLTAFEDAAATPGPPDGIEFGARPGELTALPSG